MTFLEIQHICYAPQEELILNNLTFTVERGEFLTISGPSGGGKSTLLKIIASLQSPTSGQILFEGNEQASYAPDVYRQLVSYCFQQPTLFGSTVKENLAFPFLVREKPFDRQRVAECLELVALSSHFLDKRVTELSGGERQRVALIRNLLFLPKILLLDEVTVGLDAKSKTIVQQLVQQIRSEGTTILQVTHDQEEIAASEKLLWIEKGALVHEPTGSQ